MAAIDLTALKSSVASPTVFVPGNVLDVRGGGIAQEVYGLGARHQLAFTTPPMRMEPDGRRWVPLMALAIRQGAIVAIPQVDFEVGSPGSPTVDGAHAGGTTLSITGATPHYAVRIGQWLHIVVSSRRYAYQAVAQVILDASGDGDVLLDVPLRTMLTGGETVELGQPCLEGQAFANSFEYQIDGDRMVRFDISVREKA